MGRKKSTTPQRPVRLDEDIVERAELVVEMSAQITDKEYKHLGAYLSDLLRPHVNEHFAKAVTAKQKQLDEVKKRLQEENRKPK